MGSVPSSIPNGICLEGYRVDEKCAGEGCPHFLPYKPEPLEEEQKQEKGKDEDKR